MLESDGFLTELEYLFEILRSRGIALAFYLLWFFELYQGIYAQEDYPFIKN